MLPFEINEHHRRWANNRKKSYGSTQQYYLKLIQTQDGRCAFSGARLLFESQYGTAIGGGQGCHPLYAALDHIAPGADTHGHCIVSYALNDVKGHLPHACFFALAETDAWKQLMSKWKDQSQRTESTHQDFYALLRN
jgi:hypothetical protein